MGYRLRWSDESINNLDKTIDDIKSKWTGKEVDNFKEKLNHQLDLIIQNPYLFPVSTIKKGLRKAVLSKQTTIFYQIEDDIIYLAYIHINKTDDGNIK